MPDAEQQLRDQAARYVESLARLKRAFAEIGDAMAEFNEAARAVDASAAGHTLPEVIEAQAALRSIMDRRHR